MLSWDLDAHEPIVEHALDDGRVHLALTVHVADLGGDDLAGETGDRLAHHGLLLRQGSEGRGESPGS